MPYSIQTKDGIRINNIPDDIAPDSPGLKSRVAKIRRQQKMKAPESQVEPKITSEELRQQKMRDMPPTILSQRAEALGVDKPSSPELISDAEIRMKQLQESDPELFALIQSLSPTEAAAVGFQQGLRTVSRGAGKLVGADIFAESQSPALRTLTDVRGSAQLGKIAGEAAPFAAAGPLTGTVGRGFTAGGRTIVPEVTRQSSRTGIQAALGAAEGGSIAAGEDRTIGQILSTALLGGIISGFAENVFPGAGRPDSAPDEVIPARVDVVNDLSDQQIDELFSDPAQFSQLQEDVRRQAFEKLDITPTRAQTTRDPELFQLQTDIFRDAASNNRVRRALVEQEEILTNRVNGEIDAIGGVPARASDTLSDSVINKNLELDTEISSLYKSARDRAPTQKNVRFLQTADALRRNSPIDARSERTVSAVRDEMKRLGFLDPKGNPTRKTSVEASENLRQFVNSLFEGANPIARRAIKDIKDAIDDDVFGAAGEDIFKSARAAKRRMMEGLEAKKGHKFDTRATSLVADVLDGTVQPDQLVKKALATGGKYQAKELREFKNFLFSGSPEQIAVGARAWNDLRAAAMDQIRQQSFKGPLTELGTQQLSRAGLKSSLDRIGMRKLKILFSDREMQFLRDLAQVASLKEPVAGVRPKPSLTRRFENAILNKIPVFREWVPSISELADERRLLKLIDQAELIAKQQDSQFSKSLKGATLAPALIAPVAEGDERE